MSCRCFILVLFAACCGCESISGIDDFTTESVKSSDGGDAKASEGGDPGEAGEAGELDASAE